MDALVNHIALITKLLGHPLSARALLTHTLRNEEGRLDLNNLSEVLRSQGFENKLDQRPLTAIHRSALPVLLLNQDDSAAVVTDIRTTDLGTFFILVDLDGVKTTVSLEDLQAIYLGYCWFFKPKPQQDIRSELPEYAMGKSWFWKVIWRFKAYYAQALLATVLVNVLALIGSLYVMNVYDRVIPNKSMETLWALSIGVTIAIVFEFIARTVRARLTDIAGKKADLIISAALFRRVMAMDLASKPVSAGSYANNLRDFEAVREFMTSATLLALVDMPFVLLFVLVMGIVAGPLAWVPSLTLPLIILMGIIVQAPLARYMSETMKEGSQRQGLAVEAVEGLETLKTNNAVHWAQTRWERFTAITALSSLKSRDLSNLVVNLTQMAQQLNTVFLVLWGTYLIHDPNPGDRITMGALIATVILSGRALAPMSQVAGLMLRYQQSRIALQGLNSVVDRPTESDPSRIYLGLTHADGSLDFENVSFKYSPDTEPALKRIQLSIRAGEKIAIIGPIGSGKSTLLRMAAGLYQPSEGQMLFDGLDARQIDPADYRSYVSLLSQQPRLFMGTLRENLELGRMDRHVSDQQLVKALSLFGVDTIARAHPRGLDMPIGEDGQGLSGGQKQIVCLTRLVLRDPKVVLLDEPTSGLDQQSEARCLRAIEDWAQDRTILIVTHRAQVLRFVTRIVVIERGQIVLDGPRDAVMQRLMAPAAKAPPPPQAKVTGNPQVDVRNIRINAGQAPDNPTGGGQAPAPSHPHRPAAGATAQNAGATPEITVNQRES